MIEQRVRAIIGPDGVMDVDAAGRVEVAPRSDKECALILSAAHREGWSVRIVGAGTWIPRGASVDLALSTRCLVGVPDLSPADMVLTAMAGTSFDEIQATAATEGTWIAMDPPGARRSLGSILATATSSPTVVRCR